LGLGLRYALPGRRVLDALRSAHTRETSKGA
jgi:hypothetical protein